MALKNIQPAQIPPGQILTYYGDIASGAIWPEDVRIEALTFAATVDPTGNVTATPKITVRARYNFAIRSIYGAIMNPTLAGSAPFLLRFNVREQGRNQNIFQQSVSFAAIVGGGGSCVPYEWDGTYICIPGTDLEVEFTVNATLWATLVGVVKMFQITITGDYIACGPTES